jgi:hypothetical protein
LRLADYLNQDTAGKDTVRKDLDERTTTLSEVAGVPVDTGALAGCIKAGFEKEWKIVFQDYSIVTETGDLEEERI